MCGADQSTLRDKCVENNQTAFRELITRSIQRLSLVAKFNWLFKFVLLLCTKQQEKPSKFCLYPCCKGKLWRAGEEWPRLPINPTTQWSLISTEHWGKYCGSAEYIQNPELCNVRNVRKPIIDYWGNESYSEERRWQKVLTGCCTAAWDAQCWGCSDRLGRLYL